MEQEPKYWKIYRDSYKNIKQLFPEFKDSKSSIKIYQQYKFIYLTEFEYTTQKFNIKKTYGFMPPYHNKDVKSRQHSSIPTENHYNSIEYFIKNNYKYQGTIGGRKPKLIKIKQLNENKNR